MSVPGPFRCKGLQVRLDRGGMVTAQRRTSTPAGVGELVVPARRTGAPRALFSRLTTADLGFAAVAASMVGWAWFLVFRHIGDAAPLSDEFTYFDAGWRYITWDDDSQHPLPEALNFVHPPLAKLLFGLGQLLSGEPSLAAARAVSGVCTLLTAVVLGTFIGALSNRWAGLFAAGLLVVIPMQVEPQITSFHRAAMVDNVAQLFVMLSVVLAYWWFTTDVDRAPWLAVATGTAIGMATAAKENGFLAVVGCWAVGFVLVALRRQAVAARVVQSVLAAGASLVTFVACYLPFGTTAQRIETSIRFQWHHSSAGHLVDVAGHIAPHQPWWSNFWFAAHSMGTVVTTAIVLLVAAAVLLGRNRVVGWLLSAMAGPVIFHSFVAGVTLPFYWVMWMPPVLGLAAIGAYDLYLLASQLLSRRTSGRRGRPRVAVMGAVSLMVLAPFAPAAYHHTVTVARLTPEAVIPLASLRIEHRLHGTILFDGVPPLETKYYLAGARAYFGFPQRDTRFELAAVDTVVVGKARCEGGVEAAEKALIAVNLADHRMTEIHADRLLTVYQVIAPLLVPTAAETASFHTDDRRIGC